MNWLYLAVAVLAEVIATSALKASDGFSRAGPVAVLAVGYALAFFMLSKALRTIPVGVAYAIWSGAGIVLVSVVGYVAFRQRLDPTALVGMAFIVVGVVLMQAGALR
ncbi:MAG: multidrug efflux SMR transporter [Pseudomonadota bacterium]